ncbi:ATP-binding protein [Solihabitans fulvus]|uniref:ATP-binding protein n=1 Tax=Solihabitans fulvus TaxID=1892852 RepID=A0A5B2XSY3_9PSEU|nr:ATP-binding protein [Solihabitans fulvus]KAA2266566.1 ATP-binding protein [Solihabitans fulvus]
MKIAFVGKGGSGKTTLASLLISHLADQRRPVLALDADINQHLAVALGATEDEAAALPALGAHLPLIKDHLRGANPRIASADAMIKTTPPGAGSRLLRVAEDNPVYRACVREVGGARLAVTGPFAERDLGVACYHSKVGAVELLLNHLVDGDGEYVVVDMTAGADSFASGLFTRFDVTFLVCEPTVRSVAVYRQYLDHARDFGVRIAVVGNKVSDERDLEFLRDRVGDDLLTWLGRSDHVRAAERGEVRPIGRLEQANRAALAAMCALAEATDKDWPTYQRQAVEFHLRNARAWGNDRAGADLADQVDPDFVISPDALSRSGHAPVPN